MITFVIQIYDFLRPVFRDVDAVFGDFHVCDRPYDLCDVLGAPQEPCAAVLNDARDVHLDLHVCLDDALPVWDDGHLYAVFHDDPPDREVYHHGGVEVGHLLLVVCRKNGKKNLRVAMEQNLLLDFVPP